jgi:AmiR/NasT family two-component response regulator
VEKAKGILMKTRGLDEDAAYAALRKLARVPFLFIMRSRW